MKNREISEAVAEYVELLKGDMRIHAEVEHELCHHPLSASQMEPLEQMTLARRKDFCSLICRIKHVERVLERGGDWAAVHRDVQKMEAETRLRYEPLDALLFPMQRAIREQANS